MRNLRILLTKEELKHLHRDNGLFLLLSGKTQRAVARERKEGGEQ
jgi:hypothetical protein